MAKKAPRRTAERILEVTLELFNRFGEPNVSTTLISAELNISRAISTTTIRPRMS
jgi:AcrR family transcriptional regulator